MCWRCPCDLCPSGELSIGVDGNGPFSLNQYPRRGITTLDNWVSLLSRPDVWIKDEYGDRLTLAQFLQIVGTNYELYVTTPC